MEVSLRGRMAVGWGESGMARGREGMCDSVNSALRGGGVNRVRGDGRRGRRR